MAFALCVTFATTAFAEDLPGLHPTGVGADGVVLGGGESDPHWDLVEVPAGTTFDAPGPAIATVPHPAFIQNDSNSGWIGTSWSVMNGAPGGTYVFQTTFDMEGFDPASAELTGRFAVDNYVTDVILNGTSLGIGGGHFKTWTDLLVTSGFVSGENVLQFVVVNAGAGPSGLRVEISGTADVLETTIELDIDIRPRSAANRVMKGMRYIPVAIHGSAEFDPKALDIASLRLGGAVVAKRWWSKSPMARVRDVDGDGFDDLFVAFDSADLDLYEDVVALSLTGVTTDGVDVVGSDDVTVVRRCLPWRVSELEAERSPVRRVFARLWRSCDRR